MAMTREDAIHNKAYKAAEWYYDNVATKGGPLTPPEKAALSGPNPKDDYILWAKKIMASKMMDDPEYSEENWDQAKEARLNDYKDADVAEWMFGRGKSPEDSYNENRYKMFLPLLKDGAWYNMSAQDLAIWANKPEHGYDFSNKESKKKFYDDLSRYDQQYNRASIVGEYENSIPGKVAAAAYPTMYEEGVKQALSGDYNDDKLYQARDLDVATQLAMMMAPGRISAVVKDPIGTPLAMGLAEGALKGISELSKSHVVGDPELKPNPGDILLAGSAGAAAPAAGNFIARYIGSLQTPQARALSSGFKKGARSAYADKSLDPEAIKLESKMSNIQKTIEDLNTKKAGFQEAVDEAAKDAVVEEKKNGLKEMLKAAHKEGRDYRKTGTLQNVEPTTFGDEDANPFMAVGRNYSKAQDALNRMGFSEDETVKILGSEAAKPKYSVEKSISIAEPKILERLTPVEKAAHDKAVRNADKVRSRMEPKIENIDQQLEAKNAELAALKEGNIYATREDLAQHKKAYGLGLVGGSLVGSVGGKVEPVIGFGVQDIMAGKPAQEKARRFRESDWYKSLPEERKSIVEAALKEYEKGK